MSLTLPAIYGAAALLANSTVWIFGGYSQQPTNGLYSLDLSKNWDTSSPSFSNLSSYANTSTFSYLYPRQFSSMVLGTDGASLWIYGGYENGTDLTNSDEFAVFNTQTKGWSDPQNSFSGIQPPAAYGHSAVINSNGDIYYYGGYLNNTDPDSSVPTNSPALMSFDTHDLDFELVNKASGINGTLAWHTATLVNNTLMYVIGGLMKSPAGVPSPYFYNNVYNIATKRWHNPINSAQYPSGRHGHTAVLDANGSQIIIFGGVTPDNVFLNDVWTLDLTTYQWLARNTTGNAPSGRAFHNSVLFKNQMIVMFGADNMTYVLDTVTWTWVTSFSTNPSATSSSSLPSETSSTPVYSIKPISAAGIAGITIAGVIVLGVAIISIVNPRNRVKPRV